MTRRVMGMETEYALAAGDDEGSRKRAAEALLALARRRLPHLRGARSTGVFLSSGARFYVDVGAHPEFATAEVDSPLELVRYLAAGDATVADLTAELRAAGAPGEAPVLLKSNVCYANPGATFASHESYLHAGRADVMARQLIPFLVSRVLFGAGGLNPLCPGIQPSLSPRVHLFTQTVGGSTTGNRAIYNTRDESLSRPGASRLHVIVGDSTHSQVSQFVKVGSTALVVLMAELGIDLGGPMQLTCPLIALHSFATDPQFRMTADRLAGAPVTALDIQEHYLRAAEGAIGHPAVGPWAGEVCRRWREALDLARRGPAAAGAFDWAVKFMLFDRHVRRRGADPASFGAWNHALTCVRDAHRRATQGWHFGESVLFGDHPAVAAERRNQEDHLRAHGLCWEQAGEFLKLRAELCEIDLRCAQMVPAGLFAELEAHLPHRLIDPDRVREACAEPPHGTRARFRGEQVRRLWGRGGCAAEWEGVWDGTGMYLDLSDPLEEAPAWKSFQPERPNRPRPNPVNECALVYAKGDYAAAYAAASRLLLIFAGGAGLSDDDRRQLLRVVAWTRGRNGEIDPALAALDTLAAETDAPEMPLWLVNDYVGVFRKSSLAPDGRRFWALIEEGERALGPNRPLAGRPAALAERAVLLGHKGYALCRQGRAAEATEALRQSCADATGLDRIRARSLADLADARRLVGDVENAGRALEEAERLQSRGGFAVDLADHTLPVAAKLATDRDEALQLLRKAQRSLRRRGAPIASARALLLQARLCGRSCRRVRLRGQLTRLVETTPSLRQCPAVGRVMDSWDAWGRGEADPGGGKGGEEAFWWL